MFKLAIIGEGPEENEDRPFSKGSGLIVSNLLSAKNIPTTRCFLGYVSTKRTFRSQQSKHDLSVIEGMRRLTPALAEYSPNCVLVLGELANQVFGGPTAGCYTARGSLYRSPNFGYKCLCSLDPWQVQREYSLTVPFKVDLSRAIAQSHNPHLTLPPRNLHITPSFPELCKRLRSIIERNPTIAFDLEGHPDAVGVTCFSIAETPNDVFIVPFRNMGGSPYWSLEEEMELWRLTSEILSNPNIKKIAQNGMYEMFVFAYRHQILIRGMVEDTMFKSWELFSELPKGLDFISSIYTDEPYYKDERTIPDINTHHEYCCKDSAVTLEASNEMDKALVTNKKSLEHYRFNINLIRPYTYMQLRGCKLDLEEIARQKVLCWDFIRQQQGVVNEMTGRVLNTKSHVAMKDYLYNDLRLKPKYKVVKGEKKLTSDFNALCELFIESELPVLLEISKVARARTRFSDLNKLVAFADGRIRCNYNPVGTETGRLSSQATNVNEYVTLHKIKFVDRSRDGRKFKEMQLAPVRELQSLGTNLQNVTKDLRTAFIPDEDSSFFQYDLSGADAWTVAADCAALGNDKMLVHLRNQIKPSIVIVLLTEFGQAVYQWDLPTLKQHHDAMLKRCKTEARLVRTYVCAKACQHGTNYGMQAPLMASLQLERSVAGWVDNWINGIQESPQFTSIHKNTISRLQKLYIDFYGIETRNEYIRRQLANFGYIDCASGQRRHFLDIRSRSRIDDSIVRVAASTEPQANTTWATNAALIKMYYDRSNRDSRGNLKCEPLLMVHDALCGQSHNNHLDYSKTNINEWFNNELLIHNIPITIPVEGGWGDNWKYTDG